MKADIRHVAELDLGLAASREATEMYFRDLINALSEDGLLSLLLLKHEIAIHASDAPPERRIEIGRDPQKRLTTICGRARKGFGMAMVFEDAARPLRTLELRGYEKSTTTSPASDTIVQNWVAWLGQFLSGGRCALVFGHDFEPVFLFERIETARIGL